MRQPNDREGFAAAAQSTSQAAALAGLIPTNHILFGSDFPYRALGETAADTMPQLGLSEADLDAIGRDNALALLPRFKAG